MKFLIRPAILDDIPTLMVLLNVYMKETFDCDWHGSRDVLASDGFGAKFDFVLAEDAHGQTVAFCAWQRSYDLHHCMAGAEVIDMFVLPEFRGRAVFALMLAEVASKARAFGGVFVKGQAVPRPTVQALYERIAMSFPGADCIVGGRAFRALADLAGQPPRFVVRHLPDKAWNYEA